MTYKATVNYGGRAMWLLDFFKKRLAEPSSMQARFCRVQSNIDKILNWYLLSILILPVNDMNNKRYSVQASNRHLYKQQSKQRVMDLKEDMGYVVAVSVVVGKFKIVSHPLHWDRLQLWQIPSRLLDLFCTHRGACMEPIMPYQGKTRKAR